MKKIKKILLTAVAMTMLASTAVSAYTMDQAAAQDWPTTTVEGDSTYQDQFVNTLVSKLGLKEENLSKVTDLVAQLPAISEANSQSAIEGVQYLLDKTNGKSNAEIKKEATGLLMYANNKLGAATGLYFDVDPDTLTVSIYSRTAEGLQGDKSYGSFTQDELRKIKEGQSKDDLVNKISDKNIQSDLATAMVEITNNDPGAKVTETKSLWETFTEDEKQAYVDAMTKAEEIDAILKKAEANNGADLAAKMDELKKIVADMPEGALKTQLQAAIDNYEKKYGKFEEGKTYKLEDGSSMEDVINGGANNAAQNGTTSNGNSTFQASNGSLKKTATNNGNMAVAGLAMIAVAGTVFVVSKKKIAE